MPFPGLLFNSLKENKGQLRFQGQIFLLESQFRLFVAKWP